MTLAPVDAERILRARLGAPAKPPADYVLGFATPSGKVLAIHREASGTRVWFQPPRPPELGGMRLLDDPSNGNSNLNGPLLPLKAPTTLRVEVDSADALHRFLDWYLAGHGGTSAGRSDAARRPANFNAAFQQFQELVKAKSGHPFRDFHEGLAAAWESYKPRLRDHALGLLRTGEWSKDEIGSGAILNRMIEAIEIQENRSVLTNNLVFWQNRFGHANRDHRVLLEATSNPKLRRMIEELLFGLYCGDADEEVTFDRLADLTGGKYPLLAYLFFLKDMDRFMPIQPTGFDRAFGALGIDFTTLRQCHWENYTTYNATLDGLRPLIADAARLKAARLVDAHSFCWILSTLLKQKAKATLERASGAKDAGRILGGRERSIAEMASSIENTVRNANGQIVQRTVKNKDLKMSLMELEALLAAQLKLQGDLCALTGIPFDFSGPDADKNLLPSADRIDSNGHYETGNIQIVCRFINFWKGASDNDKFNRLLMLVRGVETEGELDR